MIQLLQTKDSGDLFPVIQGLKTAFDDGKVAQLLATALAVDGGASERLVTIFGTLVPDAERQQRVLTLTRNLLRDTDFGGRTDHRFRRSGPRPRNCSSRHNESAVRSASVPRRPRGASERADRLPARPARTRGMDEDAWAGERPTLSVTLLMDLTLEDDATRAAELAHDMEALAEDLLMRAYTDGEGGRGCTSRPGPVPRRPWAAAAAGRRPRRACDVAGDAETLALLGDLEEAHWEKPAKSSPSSACRPSIT